MAYDSNEGVFVITRTFRACCDYETGVEDVLALSSEAQRKLIIDSDPLLRWQPVGLLKWTEELPNMQTTVAHQRLDFSDGVTDDSMPPLTDASTSDLESSDEGPNVGQHPMLEGIPFMLEHFSSHGEPRLEEALFRRGVIHFDAGALHGPSRQEKPIRLDTLPSLQIRDIYSETCEVPQILPYLFGALPLTSIFFARSLLPLVRYLTGNPEKIIQFKNHQCLAPPFSRPASSRSQSGSHASVALEDQKESHSCDFCGTIFCDALGGGTEGEAQAEVATEGDQEEPHSCDFCGTIFCDALGGSTEEEEAEVATQSMHARDNFLEQQCRRVRVACAVHASRNAVGSDEDPALSLESFSTISRGMHLAWRKKGFGEWVIQAAFDRSSSYDSYRIPVDTSRKHIKAMMEFLNHTLQGVVFHSSWENNIQHWEALRRQSSGKFIWLDSFDEVINRAMEMTSDEAAEMLEHMLRAGHRVLVITSVMAEPGSWRKLWRYSKVRAIRRETWDQAAPTAIAKGRSLTASVTGNAPDRQDCDCTGQGTVTVTGAAAVNT